MGSFARYVIACVALLVAAFALEGGLPRLTRQQWFATFVLGLLGVFAYNLFFMGALERLPGSRAALIIALNPVITITISSFVLDERLSPRRWIGVVDRADRRVDRDLAWRHRQHRLGGRRAWASCSCCAR